MYSIEGRVSFAKRNENLIGQYGMLYSHVDEYYSRGALHTDTKTAHAVSSNKKLVERYIKKLKQKGFIPENEDVDIEKISTQEQAEKYPRSIKQKNIQIVRFRKPDLIEAAQNLKVPSEMDLVEGYLRLWQEMRIPSPYIYVLAKGQLLEIAEFNEEEGWHNPFDSVKGNRTVKGLVTPIGHLVKTNEHTETRKTTYKRW